MCHVCHVCVLLFSFVVPRLATHPLGAALERDAEAGVALLVELLAKARPSFIALDVGHMAWKSSSLVPFMRAVGRTPHLQELTLRCVQLLAGARSCCDAHQAVRYASAREGSHVPSPIVSFFARCSCAQGQLTWQSRRDSPRQRFEGQPLHSVP